VAADLQRASRQLFEEVSGMKRMATGLCVAAALSCIATLGAQTPSTSTSADQRTSTMDKAKEVTLTGCLSKGADGKYMLSNAQTDNSASAAAGTSGSASAGATGSATAGTSGASTPAATAGAASTPAASWALSGSSSDLDKHVGHKIQVTGQAAMDSSMDHGRTPDSASAAGSSAAGSSATGSAATGSAAGTAGTSGSTATAATEEQRSKSTSTTQPQLDVKSVKMIAATCS